MHRGIKPIDRESVIKALVYTSKTAERAAEITRSKEYTTLN